MSERERKRKGETRRVFGDKRGGVKERTIRGS